MYKIVKINPVIFRGYDLRGVVDEDLNENVYYTLGRGYATYLSKWRISQAGIGRDNRLTSELYSKAFRVSENCHSTYFFQTKGGAMVTASHNPSNYNGLKLGTGYSETMVTDEIQELRRICEKADFSTGKGKDTAEDISTPYFESILKYFHLHKHWKIVVDACNTTSGMFYPKLFRQAGCQVTEQNCKLDGTFPLGVPDPTEVEVLERLAKGVKKHNADIGFAYDTDGDRMAVVDEKGQVLWMDTIVALFAQDVLDYLPGAKIVYNTLCSRQVTEAIESAGGTPVVWLTGHSFIKAKVKEEKSPFGGELSGHIFFMDNFFGHDDGAFASMRLLAYLERTKQTLSEAVAKLSTYVSSPEIKFGLADAVKFDFVATKIRAAFEKEWPNGEYIDIDGIRMDTKETMAIIRASQNGPYVTLKFEGKTQVQYNQMKQILKKMLTAFPEIDWKHGVNTNALD